MSILGVPLDNVTLEETIGRIEQMIESGQPHYLVTANVDFLVQARRDIELRRILFDADLVLCDGTPLVWASRLLGNPLPERVAGADLVPVLIERAAARGHRIFFLGATPESAARAVRNLEAQWPGVRIAGFYSPPFNKLLEMDHEEILQRIRAALPDLLFVCFGCPKQEKWLAMHYRSLGVPVAIGVGATIDFLAGEVKRAPSWMRRSGLEWVFRLAQEPKRLFRRYANDMAIFSGGLAGEWWRLGRSNSHGAVNLEAVEIRAGDWLEVTLPELLTRAALERSPLPWASLVDDGRDCLLCGWEVQRVDGTGLAWVIKLDQALRRQGRRLVIAAPTPGFSRTLRSAGLAELLAIFAELETAREFLQAAGESAAPVVMGADGASVSWRGEITACNADGIWEATCELLDRLAMEEKWVLDLSRVRFIDSTGLGLMIRFKKMAGQAGAEARFIGLQPAVRNVVRLAQFEAFLLAPSKASLPARATAEKLPVTLQRSQCVEGPQK